MSRSSRAPTESVSRSSRSSGKKLERVIGRWYIGETLGKGGYSWVKKGYDRKTGKAVALKFMSKADKTWIEEQERQVHTEIEALKQIRHPNVMKLYAYNLNAKYPDKSGKKLPVILLVLEYAPCGELFDLLFYTSSLEEDVARTYFNQMIKGLHACHKNGIAHRDLKPQNLLLDAKFQLKITDFGLSKVFESDDDTVMDTFYVGTKGYQGPELLEKKKYTTQADIFSAGVVLFIILTGYPPFEEASKRDQWYRPLMGKEYKRFWKQHRGCGIRRAAADLITKMLAYDPEKRITLEQIMEHPWTKGKTLTEDEMVSMLRIRHRKMEIKRRADASKQVDLQHSIKRDLPDVNVEEYNAEAPLLPEDEHISFTDVFTMAKSYLVLNFMAEYVQNEGGSSEFFKAEHMLRLCLKIARPERMIHFQVRVFKDTKTPANIVQFKRLEGDAVDFARILRLFVDKCARVLTGLPAELEPETPGERDIQDAGPMLEEDELAMQIGAEEAGISEDDVAEPITA